MQMFTEHIVSYLPLSHIAGQLMDIFVPIVSGATVHFAQPDALKVGLYNTTVANDHTLVQKPYIYIIVCIFVWSSHCRLRVV